MTYRPIALLALLTAFSTAAPAQVVMKQCDSLIAAAATESLEVNIEARLLNYDGTQLPRFYMEATMYEIQRALSIGDHLSLGLYIPNRFAREGDAARVAFHYLGVTGMVSLALRRNGSSTRPLLVQRSMSSDFDTALMGTINAIDAERAFPTQMNDVSGDSVALRLVVQTSLGETVGWTRLFRLRTPVFRGMLGARQLPGGASPRYPQLLRGIGVEGEVVVQFVVDASGAMAEGTVKVLTATRTEFAAAVLAVLPEQNFVPATISGCRVASLVQQPYVFSLIRR